MYSAYSNNPIGIRKVPQQIGWPRTIELGMISMECHFRFEEENVFAYEGAVSYSSVSCRIGNEAERRFNEQTAYLEYRPH